MNSKLGKFPEVCNKRANFALKAYMKRLYWYILLIVFSLSVLPVSAQDNDKILNRPYVDRKRLHYGFSVGFHNQNLWMTHNGIAAENGETWFGEVGELSPGFCVNIMGDLRLAQHFNLRINPGKRYHNLRPYVTAGAMAAFDVSKRKDGELLQLNNTNFYVTLGFGLDVYVPFFKFIPEVKFCFGFSNLLKKDRPDLVDDPEKMKFTKALDKVTSNMVVFTFYFE